MSYSIHMKGYNDPRTFYQIDRLYSWRHNQYFLPASIEISPTNLCNHRCNYCYAYTYNSSMKKCQMKSDLLKKILGSLSNMEIGGIYIQGTGEPLLHPGLSDALNGTSRKVPIFLTTNGVLLSKDIQYDILHTLRAIKFSVVEIDSERYSNEHGCHNDNLNKLINNIENAVRLRREKNLNVAFIATVYINDRNYLELYNIVEFYKKIGIDYIIVHEAEYTKLSPSGKKDSYSIALFNNYKKEMMEICKKIETLNDRDFKVIFNLWGMGNMNEKRGFSQSEDLNNNSCDGIKFMTLIDSDGEVYPCWRYWGKKEMSYGNIERSSFEEIWQSDRHKQIEKIVLNSKKNEDECLLCRHAQLNKLLYDIKNATEWKGLL